MRDYLKLAEKQYEGDEHENVQSVKKQLHPLIRGDDHGPGVVRVHSGKLIDLVNPKLENIDISDIAWSISKQVRYNGHIPYDYSVARHSIVMSYYVPEAYAMEGLLHDAGEGYFGDIIQPLKRLFPEIEKLEDNTTGLIMQKFNKGKNVYVLEHSDHQYQKSDIISHADILIYQHECQRLGRPGQYVAAMHQAELRAIREVGLKSLYRHGNDGDYEAFIERFEMLRSVVD